MSNDFLKAFVEAFDEELKKLKLDKDTKRFIREKFKIFLLKLEEILHSLIDSLEEGIIVVDEDLRIVNCNKTFSRWIGKSKENIIKKPLSKFFNIFSLEGLKKDSLYISIAKDKYIPIKAKVEIIKIDNKTFYRIITQNLQEIEKIQKKLKSILRIYKVLNLINEEIIRVQNIEDLYKFVCEILVKEGIFDFVYIGEIENDEIVVKYSYGNSAYEKFLKNKHLKIKSIKDFRNVVATRDYFENEKFNDNSYEKLYEYKITFPIFKDEYSIATLINHLEIKALLVGYFKNKKDFDPQFISILKQITHDIGYAIVMLKNKENIKYLAYYDVITNLPNRRYFFEQLDSVLKMLHEKNQTGFLILIDINKFKKINESLGFYAGDLILLRISKILKTIIKHNDLIARVGSDEFALFLMNIKDEEELFLILKEKLNNFEFVFDIDNQEVLITLSVGASSYPKDGDNKEILFMKAEAALKSIKKKGKGFLSYNRKIKQTSIEKLQIESELLQAIKNDEFELFYQPIIDIKNKNIYSFEALLRWNSKKRGLVSPGVFIPILEETGLINEVGGIILNKAAQFLQNTHNVKVSINVSVKQLQKRFFKDLIQEIEKINLDANRLIIEITESVLMENLDLFIYDIYKLHSNGIEIEIDDFGTGYSSLAYLKKLPVFALKIDRIFIKDILTSQEDKKITQAIIALAHTLDKKVVAEGVESFEQLKLLMQLECDFIQGYYFSKPIPLKEAISYLENFNFDDYIKK